jgi:hypothetical protein
MSPPRISRRPTVTATACCMCRRRPAGRDRAIDAAFGRCRALCRCGGCARVAAAEDQKPVEACARSRSRTSDGTRDAGPSRLSPSSVTVGSSFAARDATSSASVSPSRGELIARGRSLDQPPDQPASAQRKRWEHVLAAVAADARRGRGLVVRASLRKTPDSDPQRTSLAYSPSVGAS